MIERILLKEDISLISGLSFSTIKDLVKYYNISKKLDVLNNEVIFSVKFDKDKIHKLFNEKAIYYSDISEKEFYILPLLISSNEIFIFSNNNFYDNWNENVDKEDLIEFILPLENIEIIQTINKFRDNLLNLDLKSIFKEYQNKNIAIIFIENKNLTSKRVYLKAQVQNKLISKNLIIEKEKLDQNGFEEKTIFKIKNEIINLVKSQNLIDIRTPSFLNVKFNLNKKNNLVFLNSKIKNVDLIEDIFVQEFNKTYVNLKIKYFGKLDKVLNMLNNESINLELIGDEWIISIL